MEIFFLRFYINFVIDIIYISIMQLQTFYCLRMVM